MGTNRTKFISAKKKQNEYLPLRSANIVIAGGSWNAGSGHPTWIARPGI